MIMAQNIVLTQLWFGLSLVSLIWSLHDMCVYLASIGSVSVEQVDKS